MKVLLAPNYGGETPIRMEYHVPFNLKQPISIKGNSNLRMWSYAIEALKLPIDDGKHQDKFIYNNDKLTFYQWKIIDALFFCNNFIDEDCRYITNKYYLIKTSNLLYLIEEKNITQ